jgi:hypothetical protein
MAVQRSQPENTSRLRAFARKAAVKITSENTATRRCFKKEKGPDSRPFFNFFILPVGLADFCGRRYGAFKSTSTGIVTDCDNVVMRKSRAGSPSAAVRQGGGHHHQHLSVFGQDQDWHSRVNNVF